MGRKEIEENPTKNPPKYIAMDPGKSKIVGRNLSPIVVLKKIKLGALVGSSAVSLTDFLPELGASDVNQDLESLRVPNEDGELPKTNQNEEVSSLHTLTHEELNEHIQKCLEMSSENKITQKNAFALQLIDCMSFLMQKKKDFSTMACTLDAGAKIYSYRVDALYQKAMKLAEEVILNIKEKRKNNENDETVGSTAKDSRRARKKNYIASSDTLSRQFRGQDPTEKYLTFGARPGAIISKVRRDPNDLSFCLDMCTPFWPNWDHYKPLTSEGTVTLPEIKIIREKLNFEDCDLSDIVLGKEDLNESGTPSLPENRENIIFEDTSFLKNPVLERDVFISELDDDRYEESYSLEDNIKNNDEDNSNSAEEEEVGVISTVMNQLREEASAYGNVNKVPTRFEAMKMLFEEKSEYSYFKTKIANCWAGPEFWKRSQGKLNNDKEKLKVAMKKKECREIDFDLQNVNEIWGKNSNSLKSALSLSKRTVMKWKSIKNTIPRDIKVDTSTFFQLFHIANDGRPSDESTAQEPTKFLEVLASLEENNDTTNFFSQELNDSRCSQDPLDDAFYDRVSGNSESSGPRDTLNSAFFDVGLIKKDNDRILKVEIVSQNISNFGEASMVPLPKMVNFQPIKFSTRLLLVDMKHLKQAMLEVIREGFEENSTMKQIPLSSGDFSCNSKPDISFKDILSNLPGKLERRTRKDLSPAIAFTALLSLANENNFLLQNSADGDVVVKLESEMVSTAV